MNNPNISEAAAKAAIHSVHDIETLTRLWVEKTEEEKAAAIISGHFAPLLAQYEQRVRELEGERDKLTGKLDFYQQYGGDTKEAVDDGVSDLEMADELDETLLRTTIENAVNRVAGPLRTRCAELEEDKAALDWLEESMTRLIDLDTDPEMPQRYRLEFWMGVHGHHAVESSTIRAAIRAARNQQEKA